MPRKPVLTTLNASTREILNTIRDNASSAYQDKIPEITTEDDIRVVGQYLQGAPALRNEFVSALINRIAMVVTNSATFYNRYAPLKKGFIELGETIEEIFVAIAKVREFNPDKAPQRELQRNLPDVRSAFHIMNWRVQYPVTIENEQLKLAFMSFNGVEKLIADIVQSIYTAAEYDEFLLFKYQLIKALAHGKVSPITVDVSATANSAIAFRATSNNFEFMSDKYNESGVLNNTPRDRQYIFMDASFNAKFDVEVLAGAFNMDKADFIGRLFLIDDFTTFDNDRWNMIRDNSNMVEEVTEEELALLKNVQAVLVDEKWFQNYDNLAEFGETYVSSGLYWNYNYTVWKTVSQSPFSNIVAFVSDTASVEPPATVTITVDTVSVDDQHVVITFVDNNSIPVLVGGDWHFIQTDEATEAGIAVAKYGAYIAPKDKATSIPISLYTAGTTYEARTVLDGTAVKVGDTITLNKSDT